MSYLKYDSIVKVQDGYHSFHTILESKGINWSEIEELGSIVDLNLNSNIQVLIDNDTYVPVNKIKYYGINLLTRLIFETDQEILIHKNQLVHKVNDFIKVDDLVVGDLISTRDSSLKIKEIIVDFEQSHVYNLIFDAPNQEAVHYIQYDIVVK